MKIALFGGSFDPVHNAHLKIAGLASAKYNLDKVIFLPAKNPPHRERKKLTEGNYRLEMLKLAVRENPKFEVSGFELNRRTTTYTFQTINHFKRKFPKGELYFIIGEDSLRELKYWKKGYSLLKLCKFIIATRGHAKTSKHKDVLYLQNARMIESSSFIRKTITAPIIKKLLPPEVYEFINLKYLYIGELVRDYLKKNLSSAKYKHTISAAKTAVKLADKFKADRRKTLLCSLLHDIGRTLPLSKFKEYAMENKICSAYLDTDAQLLENNVFLLHSYISAHMARRIFKVSDPEILSAVANHTLGVIKKRATIYDKIIYISDTISGDRRFVGIDKIRRISFRSIDKGMKHCSRLKLHYTIKKHKWLAPIGAEVYNSYL